VELTDGLNHNWPSLERSIKANEAEISPSTHYAMAAILENVRMPIDFFLLHA